MTHALPSSAVSRRAVLAATAGAGALLAAPGAFAATPPADAMFRHGVASGDPDATSVIIWTRVTAAGPTAVGWEVSASPGFETVLRRGRVTASAARDYTAKVLVDGLSPGGTYYYRFTAKAARSPVGRARTLPTGRLDTLGIALMTCSNYAFGYFNAYDAIARDPAVDFVLHVGDYIYEYGGDHGWGSDVARTIGRVHQPANDIVSLSDYRTRHAQYKSDHGARAMHGAHTLLACWDDHEVCNNPWTGGAENHHPATQGDWLARRAAALTAYYEWMPVRDPALGHSMLDFWRAYSFGDLATLHTLETRHTARAKQIDYMEHAPSLTSAEAVARFRRDVLGAPGRRLISQACEDSVAAALRRSVAAGQPWRLIGNPSVIARNDTPDFARLGLMPDPMPQLAGKTRAQIVALAGKDRRIEFAWKGRLGLPNYTDPWDGYPWARQRFHAMARDAGAADLIHLSGDSHSFWTNRLADDDGRPAGIELGTAGISSPGDFIGSGFSPQLAQAMDAAFTARNPEVLWTTNMRQGYVRVELARDHGVATYVAVSNLLSPTYTTDVIRRVTFRKAGETVDFV